MSRYSIEYCGLKYMLVDRTKNIIIKESNSYKGIMEYIENNNIKLIKRY